MSGSAEDPVNDFVLTPGKIISYYTLREERHPVDSGVYSSHTIPFYDLISSSLSGEGIARRPLPAWKRALMNTLSSDQEQHPFHQAVMENPRFVARRLGTHFIEKGRHSLRI